MRDEPDRDDFDSLLRASFQDGVWYGAICTCLAMFGVFVITTLATFALTVP